MPVQLTCPQGHQWEAAGNPTPGGLGGLQETQCPVCGAKIAAADQTPPTDSTCDFLQLSALRPSAPPSALPIMGQESSLFHGLLDTPRSASDAASSFATEAKPVPMLPRELVEHPRYQIMELLGRGGMGTVYRAEDRVMQRVVALKVLHARLMADPVVRKRFQREITLAARLSHPNIVTAFDAGEVGGTWFLVMELVEGVPVSRLIKQYGVLPLAEACAMIRQAALGLQHAAERGLVHRDIKPSNLVLTPEGQVKILDLGLALFSSENMKEGDLTSQRSSMGTLDYMAPEQCEDSHTVDIRADIYSLGCTLYELLTGRAPFADAKYGTFLKKMMAHATAPVPSIQALRPDVPKGLADILAQMLAKDAAERFQSPAEVAEALAPFAAGANLPRLLGQAGPPVLPAPLPAARSSPAPGRRPHLQKAGLAVAVVVLVIAAGIGIYLFGRSAGQEAGQAERSAATAGKPIRVGILHSLSGTMKTSEEAVVDATLLAIGELNQKGGINGRPIETVVADGQSDWAVFAREAERLITKERVCTVFGCWTSASRKTVRPVFEEHNHLLIYPVQYEGLEQSPNIIYTGAAPNQQIIPAVKWCLGNLGRRLFLVGSDYVFPRTANAIIRGEVATLGADIVGEEYVLLGRSDVAGIVQKIVAAKPNAILNTINGDSNVAFFRELRAAGITPQVVPTISFSIAEQELRNLSSRDMIGDYAAWNYFQSIDRPENHAFVQRFRAKYGPQRVVTDPMEAAYFGVYLWSQAVAAVGPDNVPALRQAMRDQTFNAPNGPVRIDPETQHTWKTVRLGRIIEGGQFEITWRSETPLRPEPFPPSRSKTDWQKFLRDLYQGWGEQWANPGKERSE